MIYSSFIQKAIAADGRNCFGTASCPSSVPAAMVTFYKESNPVDVEIDYLGIGAIKFIPMEELHTIQNEYGYTPDNFIFAICNGDPIFLKEGKVYISLHGVYRPELIAETFNIFISNYINRNFIFS